MRRLAVAIIVLSIIGGPLLLGVLILGLVTLGVSGGSSGECLSGGAVAVQANQVDASITEQFKPEQLQNAAIVITQGELRGLPQRDIVIALATALQESGLRNLSSGHGSSLGLFQLIRINGTVEQRMDPVYSTNWFYDRLEKVEDRENMPMIEVAIAVQRPSRAAYYNRWYKENQEGRAIAILEALSAEDVISVGSDESFINCLAVVGLPIINGDVACPVGTPNHFTDTWGAPRSGGRIHKGVDIFAEAGTPLYAYQEGVVRQTSSRLGGVSLWITNAEGDKFYYAHLLAYAPGITTGKRVEIGQLVGFVGNTGNARNTPAHLHWEVHPEGGAAVNPTPYAEAACKAPTPVENVS